MSDFKQCRKCGLVFTVASFRQRRSPANGLLYPDSQCITCRRVSDLAQKKKTVPSYSTRTPYTPPTDFIPMAAPIERRELVAML